MANTSERNHCSLALRLIYAVALIFLCVGLCVLGSFRGTGDAYELKTQGTGDAQTPTVVFQLDKTMTELNEKGEEVTRYFRVTNVYINVGAAYTQKGESVTLRAEAVASPTSSASSSSGRRRELTFSNFAAEESELESDVFYRWMEMTPSASASSKEDGWLVNTYSYVKLTSRTANVLVNEVVFVGEKLVSSFSTADSTGEKVVIPASVYSATPLVGETDAAAAENAAALLDKQ